MKAAALSPLWRRIAPGNASGIATICLAFATLLAASVYAADRYTTLFGSSAGLGAGVSYSAFGADPGFSKTRIGQVVFDSGRTGSCRRVLFDNRTGHSYGSSETACSAPPAPAIEPEGSDKQERPELMTALRKSFQK